MNYIFIGSILTLVVAALLGFSVRSLFLILVSLSFVSTVNWLQHQMDVSFVLLFMPASWTTFLLYAVVYAIPTAISVMVIKAIRAAKN
ncbi:hypothetical protein [Photobacterium damselae]|uniref:hypothetical protein n=1 Tax=Photobacterium damselae TaxID=38293 RepID=UPI001F25E369|nr:hypothetical protein [Photobacterium damselae]UKA12841.1 hypothetical protein IHC91_20845 [Photobacterium damselae subsp. damselae]